MFGKTGNPLILARSFYCYEIVKGEEYLGEFSGDERIRQILLVCKCSSRMVAFVKSGIYKGQGRALSVFPGVSNVSMSFQAPTDGG